MRNCLEYMPQGTFDRVPVFFKRANTDFSTWLSYIRVENLGQEIPFGWLIREIAFDNQLASE